MTQALIHEPKVGTQISFYIKNEKIFVFIETERLMIRSYKNLDFYNCLSIYQNPSLTKYFDNGLPKTNDEVKLLIKDRGNKYFARGEPFGLFSVFDKRSNTFIGQVDIFPTEEPGVVEIGCILSKKYHGLSFGTEATEALLKDYVPELNRHGHKSNGLSIKKVIATAHPDNTPSNKMLSKCGMKIEKSSSRFGNPRNWYYYNVD